MIDPRYWLYQQLLYAIPASHKYYDELVALVQEQRNDDVYTIEQYK